MSYTKKTWENLPSTNTPLNATGMNDLETRVDEGIQLADALSIPSSTNNITSNSNLNGFTTEGGYKCQSAAIATTLSNTPYTGGAFKLIVMKYHDASRYGQFLFALSTPIIYFRTYSANGWSSWKSLMPVKIENSKITASLGNLSLNNSCIMSGDFISLNLKFTGVSVSATGSTVLATLSSEYRGTQEIGLIALVNDGTFANCWLRNTGEIVIQPLRTFSNKEVRIIGNYYI